MLSPGSLDIRLPSQAAPARAADALDLNGSRSPDIRVRYTVLGPLQIWVGGQDCAPTTPKVLQVFAMLLLRANHTVQTDVLIQELWGEEPPRSALTTIQTYVYQLRRLIERTGIGSTGDDVLVTRAPGYLLRVAPGQLDLQRFEECAAGARAHRAAGSMAAAAAELRAGLRLWTATPLSNVRLGSHLAPCVTDLQEKRRTAIQLVVEGEMELGCHRELIAELHSLIAHYPLDEWFHQQLMIALDRCGRRGDALRIYHGLRATLGSELGIDPSVETQALHQKLLS
ncbi:AfsR/SARP family transcriptional regulator [Actinokineospora sp. G85]|uniref:AfsR/SARP family transcriptional regulator n=1 Tax=Actinokineospora sp. G85 TaxID=3406626 RepID=UPI003C763184